MDDLFGKDVVRFVIDTGPQEKGKYRVVADLHKMKCPRCETVHFSAAKIGSYCFDCAVIMEQEKKIGRELTKKAQIKLLLDANLIDKSDIRRWLKQAQKKKDKEFIDFSRKCLKNKTKLSLFSC